MQLLVALLVGAGPSGLPPLTTAERVCRLLASTEGTPALPLGSSAQARALRRRLYAPRGCEPVWFDGARPNARLAELERAMASADEDGIGSEALPVATLHQGLVELAQIADDESSANLRAQLELLATDAFLLLAHDLGWGRAAPQAMAWHLSRAPADLATVWETAVQSGKVEATLRALTPPHPGYVKLRRALADLRAEAEAGGWCEVEPGPTLELGAQGERVAHLRRRLTQSGDLAPRPSNDPAAEARFDEDLVTALRRFQRRHGLTPDGRLGKKTLGALGVPVSDRIAQVEANLERWRWLPDELGDRHLWVNVPAFELQARERGEVVLTSAVVAGKRDWPTPVFGAPVVRIDAHPVWRVPQHIVQDEVFRLVTQKPEQAARMGFSVKDAKSGAPLPPSALKVSEAMRGAYRFEQAAGPQNPLGEARIWLRSPYEVFLHGTPSQNAFEAAERAFSHGCVRVQNVDAVARWLLGPSRIPAFEAALAQTAETSVALEAPVPAYLVYFTAWVDDDGLLHFGPDVYRRDEALMKKVAPRPKAPNETVPALPGI